MMQEIIQQDSCSVLNLTRHSERLETLEQDVLQGRTTSFRAARTLLDLIEIQSRRKTINLEHMQQSGECVPLTLGSQCPLVGLHHCIRDIWN